MHDVHPEIAKHATCEVLPSGKERRQQHYVYRFHALHNMLSLDPKHTHEYADRYKPTNEWACGGLLNNDCAANMRAIAMGNPPEELTRRYDEIRGLLDCEVNDVASRAPTTRRKRRVSDYGDDIDLGRYLTGDPQHWIERKRGARRKHVKLGIQFGFSAVADLDVFVDAVATGCAAADILTRLGYAVSIEAFCQTDAMCSRLNGKYVSLCVPLKAAEHRLDVRACLVAGMPALLRLAGFIAFEMFANKGRGFVSRGYGVPTRDRDTDLGYDAIIGTTFDVSPDGSLSHNEAFKGFTSRAKTVLAAKKKEAATRGKAGRG